MTVHSSQPIRSLPYYWFETKYNLWLRARPVQNDNQSYTSHPPENRYFDTILGIGIEKINFIMKTMKHILEMVIIFDALLPSQAEGLCYGK